MQDDTDGVAVPPSRLADLQAGLLDDRTAAELRRRARTEPDVARRLAALDRVRRDVADLGQDAESAPVVPTETVARIGAALRALPATAPPTNRVVASTGTGSAHAARPGLRLRGVAAVAGLLAAVAAAALGTTTLLRHTAASPPAEPTASFITVSRAPDGVPQSDEQILALLSQPAELGELTDPQRRASCLGGLGYPAGTPILGAEPLDVRGRPGILMLFAADAPSRVDALVVAPNCNSADTGLLASSVVDRR